MNVKLVAQAKRHGGCWDVMCGNAADGDDEMEAKTESEEK